MIIMFFWVKSNKEYQKDILKHDTYLKEPSHLEFV
jgi:hypothetical protein